jgi:hypothetical protein
MIKHTLFKSLSTVIIIIAVIALAGCEKKTEQKQDEMKENVTTNPPSAVNEPKDSEPTTKETINIPDLKGTWTGTFDKRSTTLTITEQTDSSFSGRISIKYKEMLNQEVKGYFSSTTKKVYMEDQIHSKYMGKYKGSLSEDGKAFSGTFTMNRDGSKTSFNLNKN